MVGEQRGLTWPRRGGLAPEFGLGALLAVAFGSVTALGDVGTLTQFHIWTGTLWTALVLGRGFGVAPLLDSRDDAACVGILSRVVPLSVVSFPMLTVATIGAGLELALTYGLLFSGSLLIQTVLALSGLITLVALGVVFPLDIRVYRRLRASEPEDERTARLGTWTARALTVQGLLQVMMLFLMYQVSGRLG
jgi:hypothetical protein